jgi:hypothetical protein
VLRNRLDQHHSAVKGSSSFLPRQEHPQLCLRTSVNLNGIVKLLTILPSPRHNDRRDAPTHSLAALAQRPGVSEADTATVIAVLEEEPPSVVAGPAAAPVSPFLPMTGPNGVSSASKTLLNKKIIIAARKRATQSKMSC